MRLNCEIMEVEKNEAEIIGNALTAWEQAGQLTPQQAADLRQSVTIKRNDRLQIAQYFFFIALFCTLLAFGAIFLNEKLLERIKAYFSWSDLVIAMITALLAAMWMWYIYRKRGHLSPTAYEVDMVLGGLSVLTSLLYFCKEFHIDKTYTAFLGITLPTLAVLSVLLRSKALWIGTLVAAVMWFGAYTEWQGSDNQFLGMNYPMRYTVFGLIVLGISLVQDRVKQLAFTQQITYVAGLILVFAGLWGISIFGNYNTLAGWQAVRQVHVLAYSIVFAAGAAISFYLGIRYKDELARDFGVLFLLINLYTRYFEYFWDTMNKGIFFLVLAITFGFVGWWLERKSRAMRKGQ